MWFWFYVFTMFSPVKAPVMAPPPVVAPLPPLYSCASAPSQGGKVYPVTVCRPLFYQ